MRTAHEHIADDGFRLRGTDGSRLDSFSDVVFGFALTIIVVSQVVPRTYDQLHAILIGFYPFAITFFIFASIWYRHFIFFRRFGLHDIPTIVINGVLLFTVLLYVYPLKFLFTLATGNLTTTVFSTPFQFRELMIVYGAGFAAIHLCFAALYANAWRQRERLGLNSLEITLTLVGLRHDIGDAFIGLLCCLVARLLPPDRAPESAYCFLLMIFWGRIHALYSRRHIRAARAHHATG